MPSCCLRINWRASLVNIRHIAVDARDSGAVPEKGLLCLLVEQPTSKGRVAAGKTTWYRKGLQILLG